jgi:hypothetical protein
MVIWLVISNSILPHKIVDSNPAVTNDEPLLRFCLDFHEKKV